MYKILIVEDDPSISSLLCRNLESWGYQAACVQDFSRVLDTFLEQKPDFILMDLYLPDKNGFYWTEQIRRHSAVPILFVSSADEGSSVITALGKGADDYITKPFDLMVLTSKIQAMLRRSYDYPNAPVFLEHKGVRFDPASGEVFYGEQSTELSKNEGKILKILLENKNKIVERETLMEALWKTDCWIDENTLSVNVNRLRKKLESIGIEDFIETKKGAGYKI